VRGGVDLELLTCAAPRVTLINISGRSLTCFDNVHRACLGPGPRSGVLYSVSGQMHPPCQIEAYQFHPCRHRDAANWQQ